jgi:acetyl esterase
MATAVLEANTTEFDVDDVEYLRHGDKPLLASIFKPRGAGRFRRSSSVTAAPGA